MKLKYQNGHYTYIHRRPYENYSFGALTALLSHAKPGSEEHEVIEREIRLRKKEPKQDSRQTMLFNGSEWADTKSPWCQREMETMKSEWSEAEKQEAKATLEQLLSIVHDGQGQCRDCGRSLPVAEMGYGDGKVCICEECCSKTIISCNG
jgi:RNA polymerase-binding transcription factor DksA